MQANRICPHNRHWGELAEKSINNRTRGRSQKGRSWSCVVSEGGTFKEVSYMQVIPFHCVFISNGALVWDDIKGVGSLGGAWEWF